MTQLKQFIFWQFRDIIRSFKNISVGGVAALLLGAQLGSLVIAVSQQNKELMDTLALTLPLTVFLMCFGFMIEMQWARFKRDQEQVMNNLKVGASGPPQKP